MAKCHSCGREMTTSVGCKYSFVRIDGKEYKRVKVGDPGDFFEGEPKGARCGDCGAQVGHYHHWGCDGERCPSCGGQLISCDCPDIYLVCQRTKRRT